MSLTLALGTSYHRCTEDALRRSTVTAFAGEPLSTMALMPMSGVPSIDLMMSLCVPGRCSPNVPIQVVSSFAASLPLARAGLLPGCGPTLISIAAARVFGNRSISTFTCPGVADSK